MSPIPLSNTVAATIGAAIGILSAATIFIYNRIMERKKHSIMDNSIDKMNRKVLQIEAELTELRKQQAILQKNKKRRLIRRQAYSNDNSYSANDSADIDAYSIADTDVGDDEFFDCSDEEVDGIENGTIEEPIEDLEILELIKECDIDHLNGNIYLEDFYNKLEDAEYKNPHIVEIVWRFARSCYYCSLRDNDKQSYYISRGCNACEKVLNIKHGKLYEWYAILYGVKTSLEPLKGKIACGLHFKAYIEKALELNPNNGFLYYLMGRFKYEVTNLNWLEKKVATTFVAELPNESYEDAILDFKKAEELLNEPNYMNKFYLGKSYIAIGQLQEAVSCLSEIKILDTASDEEKKILSETESLLKKYSSCCT